MLQQAMRARTLSFARRRGRYDEVMDIPSHTVLVIDDDPSVRRMLKLILGQDGYEVCCASDGVQGLDALERCTRDVIVLDMQMPGMDGMTFYRTLRERGCATPVLVLSANAAAAAARELHAQGYLAKPFEPDVFTAHVARLCAA